MKRRDFIKGAALAGLAIGAPSIAKSSTPIQWQMVTSWPKNLPGPGISAERLASRINALSNGRLNVTVHPAGELVPWNGVFDAVSEGTAQMYHSVPTYWGSKAAYIPLFGSQPFGLTAGELVGWMIHGGGQAIYDEVYAQFNLKPFLCANADQQWQGWFRKEIHSLDDLKGLKYRTSGIGSDIFAKLGVAVQTMSGQEMFQALQTGAIDAGEFVGPWTDSALGFYQVAKYYYWPGLGEPASAEECVVNKKAYDALPKDLQQVIETACKAHYNDVWMEYATKNAQALQQLIKEHGVIPKSLPNDVVNALGEATKTVMSEITAKDNLSKKLYTSLMQYHKLMGEYQTYTGEPFLAARAKVYGYAPK